MSQAACVHCVIPWRSCSDMLPHTEESVAVVLGFGGFSPYLGQPKVLSLWKHIVEAVYDGPCVSEYMYSFHRKEAESRRSWPTMTRTPIGLLFGHIGFWSAPQIQTVSLTRGRFSDL